MTDNLNRLKEEADVIDSGDTLGGVFNVESGVHPLTIDVAYLDESVGGALNLNLVLKNDSGVMLRQKLYLTTSKAKGGKYYYTKNNQKYIMTGYSHAKSIASLALGKLLSDLVPEDGVIAIYDYTEKKELPKTRKVYKELKGQKLAFGIIKQIVDKNVKNDLGKYVPSGDTREENEIDAVFHGTTGLTVTEIEANITTPEFLGKWKKKWDGVTRDKSVGVIGAGSSSGAPKTAVAETEDIFG